MRTLSVALVLAAAVCAQPSSQAPDLWYVNGASAVVPGPEGSVYTLGSLAPYDGPSPVPWVGSCNYGSTLLTRVSLQTLKPVWWMCVPFVGAQATALALEPSSGDLIVAGPVTSLVATPGAVSIPRTTPAIPGRPIGVGVMRLRGDGDSRPVFAALIATNPESMNAFISETAVSAIRLLPDGSIGVAVTTTARDYPETPGAPDKGAFPRAWLLRLSGDGSRILFGGYFRNAIRFTGLTATADGGLVVAGLWDSESTPYPGTAVLPLPEDFPPEGEPAITGFVARFELDSMRLSAVARLGVPTEFNGPFVSTNATGRPVLVAGMSESGMLTAELRPDLSGVVSARRWPVSVEVLGSSIGADGSWLVAVRGRRAPPPVVAGSVLRPSAALEYSVVRFDPAGNSITGTTPLSVRPANVWGFADGRLSVGVAEHDVPRTSSPLLPGAGTVAPSFLPVFRGKRPDAILFAYPNVQEVCFEPLAPQWLMWDVRDVPPSGKVEVRLGSETGPVVARGNTGSIGVEPGNQTYVLVLDPVTGPFGQQPRVLATEQTRLVSNPVRCTGAGATRKAELRIEPNPVLACSKAPHTGTAVGATGQLMSAGLPGSSLLIRVGDSDGPVFAAGPGRFVAAATGDWVRNGMEFFLTASDAPNVPVASQRVYVLPARDCTATGRLYPFESAMQATRDCTRPNLFTLAWNADRSLPVEIRADSVDGPVVARMAGPSGLLDVQVDRPTTFFLVPFRGENSDVVARAVADPSQACGQGRAR